MMKGMSDRAAELLEKALSLTPEERAELAKKLVESLLEEPDPDVDAAWMAEAQRRLERIEREGWKGRDWAAVRASLERSLGK